MIFNTEEKSRFINFSGFFLFTAVVFLIGLSACYKDVIEDPKIEIVVDDPVIIISTVIVGYVTDESGLPVTGVVSFNGQEREISSEGYFQLPGIEIDKYHEVLRIQTQDGKDFYFQVATIENDVNYLHLTLFSKVEEHLGQSSNQESFTISDRGQLQIEKNAMLINGTNYTGRYEVGAFSLDLQNPQERRALPEMKRARDLNDRTRDIQLLEATFMELQSTQGEELTFMKNGAQIKYDIQCAECLPFYFDVERRSWVELEQIQNPEMIPVTKSGFYALGKYQDQILLQGMMFADGIPVPHVELNLLRNGQLLSSTQTTNNGRWSFLAPQEANLEVQLISPCGIKLAKQVRTESEDQIAETIELGNEAVKTTIIQGTARDCDDQPLQRHFLSLASGDYQQFIYSRKANFTIPIIDCDVQQLIVQSKNGALSESGPEITWPVSDEIEVYSTYACNAAKEEYVVVRIDNKQKIYRLSESAFENDRSVMRINSADNTEEKIVLWITGMSPGKYADAELNILFDDPNFNDTGYSLNCPTSNSGCGFETFDLTHFGDEMGSWIRGYFKGRFWVKTYEPLQAVYKDIEGEFQIYRDF